MKKRLFLFCKNRCLFIIKKSGVLFYITVLASVIQLQGQPTSPPFGYFDKGDSIQFIFGQQSKIRIGTVQIILKDRISEIHEVTVAGDFNDWNPKNEKYLTIKGEDHLFKLTVAKTRIGKKGDIKQFNFVINQIYWVEPPPEAINQYKGKDGNVNLTLKL